MRDLSFRWVAFAAWVTMISVVTGCGAGSKPSQSAGSEEKKATAVGERAPGDEAQVRGDWICVLGSMDGQPECAPEGCHALFTDKELKLSSHLGAAVYEYHLDPQSCPKRCDLLRKPFNQSLRAIYSLEGSKLRLGMPISPNKNAPYPASFEPGKGLIISTYKRLEKRTRTDEASLSPQQKAAIAGQRKEMAEIIKGLEEKKYSEFAEFFFPSEARDAIKQHKNGTEEMLKYMEKLGPSFAQLLRTLSSEVPAFNSDASCVTYDVRAIHFNGLPPTSAITLVKADGHWHMDNSTNVGQGK